MKGHGQYKIFLKLVMYGIKSSEEAVSLSLLLPPYSSLALVHRVAFLLKDCTEGMGDAKNWCGNLMGKRLECSNRLKAAALVRPYTFRVSLKCHAQN